MNTAKSCSARASHASTELGHAHPSASTATAGEDVRGTPIRAFPLLDSIPRPFGPPEEPSWGSNLTRDLAFRNTILKRRLPPRQGHDSQKTRTPTRMDGRRKPVLLATLAIALAAPAPALASDFRPADSYPELGAILPIARAAWPDSPCRDREQIRLVASPMIRDGEQFLGYASPHSCQVELDATILTDQTGACRVLTHELGHLAGNGHSDDPANVMSLYAPYAPCSALAPPAAAKKCRQKARKARRSCQRRRAHEVG